jgi:hypothetical protein
MNSAELSDYYKGLYRPATLCELCKNACGNCPWSEKDRQTPVKGWDAIRNDIACDTKTRVESYVVLDCPLFELEEHNRWAYEKFDREAIRKRLAEEGAV